MKKMNKWKVVAVVCLVLIIAAVCGNYYCSSRAESVQQMSISTGGRNYSMAYDMDNDILYVGTYGGTLSAYQNGKELWKTETVTGPYSELVLNQTGDKLYTSCEDNHVYVYQTSDGSQLLDINVQRRVLGVSANGDESKIAVVTNTGPSKSNLMVYSAEGEELSNTQYTTEVLREIKYHEDGETLIVATKKGEVRHITESGEVLDTYKTGYEIKQMKYHDGIYWVVCRDGSYHAISEDLECLREGKITNTIHANVSCIGVDAAGEYVLIGTEEGYIFVMDGQDEQIYMGDYETELTDTAAADGMIYFTGFGDFINLALAENLAYAPVFQTMTKVFLVAAGVLTVMFIISFIAGFEKLRIVCKKLLKKIWKNRFAYLMLLPTFILLFFFSYRGIFIGLSRAFTNWSADNYHAAEIDFVGLDNFKAMFEEGYFLVGFKNLILLLITKIAKTMTMPLLAAWLIYSIKGNRRKYIHRFLFVLPMVVPVVVVALVWQKIYSPNIGLLNQLLGAVGLESLQRVWLGDPDTAMGSILAMGFPYIEAMPLLVYYGGFLNIGEDVIESASIDGAGRWKIFWKIQLPLIKSQMGLLVTLAFINVMKDFIEIYIMTGGGPSNVTYVPALELYLNVTQFGRYGYASAMGIVLLIFTLTVTAVSNKLKRGKEE